jgi:outer membrane protein OmpA-like peptidoglycan-associated protein
MQLALVEYRAGELVKTIYHNYNQADIQNVSARELDEIAYFLLANPTAVVSVESHTDSRGGDVYNLELSKQRAKAAYDYLLAKGVSRNSLRSIGRGEAYIINVCKEGVPCTEEEHARNRRTAVWVMEVGK